MIYLFYIVAFWFLFILLSSKDNKLLPTILFLSSVFNILIVNVLPVLSLFSYEERLEFIIKLDGATALILTMIMTIDKLASKQAVILILMVLCHTMILLHLITDSYFIWAISKPIYHIYDELIIMLAILQLWVSRDGMVKGLDSAFRSLQSMLFRFVFHSYRIYKSSFTSKKIKGRT